MDDKGESIVEYNRRQKTAESQINHERGSFTLEIDINIQDRYLAIKG